MNNLNDLSQDFEELYAATGFGRLQPEMTIWMVAYPIFTTISCTINLNQYSRTTRRLSHFTNQMRESSGVF